jgi:glutaredoxin-like protein
MYVSEGDRHQLAEHFGKVLREPVQVWLFGQLDEQHPDDPLVNLSAEAHQVLNEICELSPLLELVTLPASHPTNDAMGMVRWPAITITHGQEFEGVRFYGIPSGYEFAALLETLTDVSRRELGLDQAKLRAQLAALESAGVPIHIQVFSTPSCPYCPVAAHMAVQFARASQVVQADCINAHEFPELIERYRIHSVPHIVINETTHFVGAVNELEFAEHLVAVARQHAAPVHHPDVPEGPASAIDAREAL